MKDKQCVICGKTYTPTGTKQSYCSYDCYLVAQKRRRAKKPVELKCEWCGKTFTQRLGRIYCSPECSKAAAKEYHKRYSRQYHAMKMAARPPKPPKPPKTEKIRKPKVCPVCQGEFFTKNYRKTFCSPECRKKDHQKKMRDAYRIGKAKLMAEEMPEPEHKPVYHFSEPAPKAKVRINAARLPKPYIKKGAVKCV